MSGAGAAVHVVDDDAAVLRAIGILLASVGFRAILHASAADFLGNIGSMDGATGCLLTDMRMPGLDGFGLLRCLQERHFDCPVIVMTAHGDIPMAVAAMRAGAVDFIEKPFDEERLLAALEPALSQGDELRAAKSAARALARLSRRESEVLRLLVEGKSNKAIALDLDLSPRTVEVHRARLMARLGVHSLADAIKLALRAEPCQA